MPALTTILALGALGAGASVLSKQKTQAADAERHAIAALPTPEAPIAPGVAGEADATTVKKSIKAGREGTKLTGSLVPTNIGKKKLLGG